MTWDTVVIGSGPGGLTAAVALARAGQKVLVLEQHYLPGGWTHSFSLEGYRFSPGVHYIGDLGPGGGVRRMWEGLGLGRDLEFCELNPDGFDHFLIAGERFDQPKGRARWIERLVARFPHERQGIVRYFDTLDRIVADVRRCETLLGFPSVLTVPFRAPTLVRWGFSTLASLLDSCVKDPLLRGVLGAQAGDHGLAPSRVSLPLHASMTAHYYDGGYYPRGGAKRIPGAYLKELRRRGGEIRMRTRVREIRVEGGRACGVVTEAGETIRAGAVVCNADPAVTYGKLLPSRYCRREVAKARRMEYSVSLISIFCAVDMDLGAMGYDSGNYWFYRDADVNGLYERMEREMPDGDIDGLFLTITTLKDPGHARNGHHTLEMFTFVPYAPFARWAGVADRERDPSYQAKKRDLEARMLAAAENVIPGLREHLRFSAVGTPLTNDFYCESFRGASYGTAKTPWQLGPFSFATRAPVEGLWMCGSSTLSHGVAGAATSGLMAAQRMLGAASLEDLLGPADGSLRVYPADRPEQWLRESDRHVGATVEDAAPSSPGAGRAGGGGGRRRGRRRAIALGSAADSGVLRAETEAIDMPKDDRRDDDKNQAPSPVAANLFKSRTVLVFGEVDSKLAQAVTAQLLALAVESDDPIRLFINSQGGHVESGDTIHDMIRFIKPEVKVVGTGWVASAGALIYVAAKRENRVCLPNTRFLLHQPMGGVGGQASDIEIETRQMLRMRERLNRIFAKETGQTYERIVEETERNFWMTAAEAKEYGLVGRIVERADQV